jgi:hypothetical protein
MLADNLTKPLSHVRLEQMVKELVLVTIWGGVLDADNNKGPHCRYCIQYILVIQNISYFPLLTPILVVQFLSVFLSKTEVYLHLYLACFYNLF